MAFRPYPASCAACQMVRKAGRSKVFTAVTSSLKMETTGFSETLASTNQSTGLPNQKNIRIVEKLLRHCDAYLLLQDKMA
jgi:hypothetical protein